VKENGIMTRKILVTVVAGSVGSHLVDALLERGHAVRVLDNLDPQVHGKSGRPNGNLNLAAEFLRGDMRDLVVVQRALEGMEAVFHLAAAVGVKYVLENPLRSLLTNIRGTEVVLEACAQHRRRVLVFSSSEVYGKGAAVPFAEGDDRVMGPTDKLRWSYACGKAVDECMAQAYWQQQQLG